MTDVLLTAVLLASILTLAIAIRTLLSSRRSEVLHESRYDLLRDQQDRLEFLREERQTLIEELERRSQERQQLMEFVGKTPSQLIEDLETARRGHLEAQKRIEDLKQDRSRLEQELHQLKEQLEQEHRGHLESRQRAEQLERGQTEQTGTKQEAERLGQERQRLTEDLKREREERLGAQRGAEQQAQERARLEKEFRSLKAELDRYKQAPARDRAMEAEASRSWWRRPVLIVGLLFGGLLAWLASLMVALYILSP